MEDVGGVVGSMLNWCGHLRTCMYMHVHAMLATCFLSTPVTTYHHSFIFFFQDDLSLKEDHLIDIVTNKPLPRGFYVSGSPTIVHGLPNRLGFGESRVIN